MMEHEEIKTGVKIQSPLLVEEKLHPIYYLLVIASAVFILVTLALLILEGTGTSLPTFLRIPLE